MVQNFFETCALNMGLLSELLPKTTLNEGLHNIVLPRPKELFCQADSIAP